MCGLPSRLMVANQQVWRPGPPAPGAWVTPSARRAAMSSQASRGKLVAIGEVLGLEGFLRSGRGRSWHFPLCPCPAPASPPPASMPTSARLSPGRPAASGCSSAGCSPRQRAHVPAIGGARGLFYRLISTSRTQALTDAETKVSRMAAMTRVEPPARTCDPAYTAHHGGDARQHQGGQGVRSATPSVHRVSACQRTPTGLAQPQRQRRQRSRCRGRSCSAPELVRIPRRSERSPASRAWRAARPGS